MGFSGEGVIPYFVSSWRREWSAERDRDSPVEVERCRRFPPLPPVAAATRWSPALLSTWSWKANGATAVTRGWQAGFRHAARSSGVAQNRLSVGLLGSSSSFLGLAVANWISSEPRGLIFPNSYPRWPVARRPHTTAAELAGEGADVTVHHFGFAILTFWFSYLKFLGLSISTFQYKILKMIK